MIENYSYVQLLTNKYRAEGASEGDAGSVIEVYDNGDYEVEFADENGIDFAQIVARENELRVLKAEALVSATPSDITILKATEISPSSGAPKRERLPSFK